MLGPLLMMGASGAPVDPDLLIDAVFALSPYAYWILDETSGTTMDNFMGNASYDGTISGGYSLAAQAGPDGRSYARFKEGGTAARVAIADATEFSVDYATDGMVIFALVYPDVSGATDVITKGGASSYEWRLGAGSAVATTMWNSTGSNRQTESSAAGVNGMATGKWNAIAVEYHSVTFNDRPSLFANSSTPVSTTQGSNSAGSYLNGSNQVNIGWRADGGGSPFDGAIGHVAIFPADTDISSVFEAADAQGWF